MSDALIATIPVGIGLLIGLVYLIQWLWRYHDDESMDPP